MKKFFALSALAAAMVAPAFAQSNVTIYGRLNLTVEKQNDGGVRTTKMVNNSSRIGFKGTEDLGGGLKANFVIEHGFNAATGAASGAFWGREATVGLSGKFGAVRLGRQAASEAYFATADYIGMHNHDTGTSSDAFYSGAVTKFGVGPGAQAVGGQAVGNLSNAITYTTPTFGGVNVAVQYADRVGGNHPISIGANYDAGAMHLGLGYEKLGDYKTTVVRGLYELGAFTVGGYVGMDSGAVERTFYRLAGAYTQGNASFHLDYGQAGGVSGIASSGATQLTLGYNYNLSKRTKAYTFYTRVDNSQNADYMSTAGDFSSWAVGLRHNF